MLTLHTGTTVSRVPLLLIYSHFGKYPTATRVKTTEDSISLLWYYLNEGVFFSSLSSLVTHIFPKTSIMAYGRECLRIDHNFVRMRRGLGVLVQCTDISHLVNIMSVQRFGLFNDFLADYPGETVTLPFAWRVVEATMYGGKNVKLVDCLECLLFLRPTRATFFLDFDLTGVKKETILEFYSYFTEQERKELAHSFHCENLREARIGALHPPNRGDGISVLAYAASITE